MCSVNDWCSRRGCAAGAAQRYILLWYSVKPALSKGGVQNLIRRHYHRLLSPSRKEFSEGFRVCVIAFFTLRRAVRGLFQSILALRQSTFYVCNVWKSASSLHKIELSLLPFFHSPKNLLVCKPFLECNKITINNKSWDNPLLFCQQRPATYHFRWWDVRISKPKGELTKTWANTVAQL